MSNQLIVPFVDSEYTGTAGTVGFVSWCEVSRILRETGQLKSDECILGFRVEEAGINFTIDKR